MGSTNTTDYLELSQFTDDDKPTFRGDYNGDMNKINGGVKALKLIIDALKALSQRQFRDPIDFGAVGDGVADDSGAFRAALAVGNVKVPAGYVFRFTSSVEIPDGRRVSGITSRSSIILNDTNINAFTIRGGQNQKIDNLLIRSQFTSGTRTNWDVLITNPTKTVLEDVEIDGAAGATGNIGIKFLGDNGLPGNHFMPQLNRVWIRNGRLVSVGVSDGHVSDSYVWANNTADAGAVDFSGVSDGWTFSSVDVVPCIGGGSAYKFTNTNNTIIIGGYADGSYEGIMTGYGIHAINSGRIFVTGWRAYNLGRSGVRLENTHGCTFNGVGFHRNNKAGAAYPDIDLYGSTGNRFITDHLMPVDRGTRGGIYREDTASTKNDLLCTNDTSIGNYYASPLVVANVGTLNPRSKPESLFSRNSGAPNVIVPPASTYNFPTAGVAYPVANAVIAHRFHVQEGAIYSTANVRVDSGSGNMQMAVLSVSGATYTRVLSTGIIPCTTGDKNISMGTVYLNPGEYALAIWIDNTTATVRYGSNTGYGASRTVAEWVDPSGIGASGNITWNGFKAIGGFTLS